MTWVFYLVAAQRSEDESIIPYNAVWELLFPILILCGPQSKRELGKLGFTELAERKHICFQF